MEKFLSKINKTDTCWLWTAHTDSWGYGKIRIGKKLLMAHRLSWTLVNGQIENNLRVLHKCDVPACVRPDHLWLGTDRDNRLDCVAKGRHNCRKPTHCKYGHEFTPENTYNHVENGIAKRQCVRCRQRIQRARVRDRRVKR